jgi:hypothetical protein
VGLWNLDASGVGIYTIAGYGFDVDRALLKLQVEFYNKGGALGFVGSIGTAYFPAFLSGPSADPYVGLDFGYGTTRTNSGLLRGTWVDGFVLGPNVGVVLFRESDVRLDVGFKWGFFFERGPFGSPSFGVFRVALLY